MAAMSPLTGVVPGSGSFLASLSFFLSFLSFLLSAWVVAGGAGGTSPATGVVPGAGCCAAGVFAAGVPEGVRSLLRRRSVGGRRCVGREPLDCAEGVDGVFWAHNAVAIASASDASRAALNPFSAVLMGESSGPDERRSTTFASLDLLDVSIRP